MPMSPVPELVAELAAGRMVILVDELLIYLAPRLLGPGRGLAAIGPLASLAESLDFELIDVERVGPDLRLSLRPPGRAVF